LATIHEYSIMLLATLWFIRSLFIFICKMRGVAVQ
jgi:hypothetical protein